MTRARRAGPEAVAGAVRDVREEAVAEDTRAVLCTCSTIGGVVETAGARVGVPVLRGDRPMAVAAGPRVVVAATLESTLAPTAALVEEEGRRIGRSPLEPNAPLQANVPLQPITLEAGDTEGGARLVAVAVDVVTGADAIVLARGSMTPAQHLTTTVIPGLSSPSPSPGSAASARAARVG